MFYRTQLAYRSELNSCYEMRLGSYLIIGWIYADYVDMSRPKNSAFTTSYSRPAASFSDLIRLSFFIYQPETQSHRLFIATNVHKNTQLQRKTALNTNAICIIRWCIHRKLRQL